MTRALPRAALLAALATAAGCADATAVRDPIVGTYALRRIDGRALPVVTASGRGVDGGLEQVTTLEQHYDFAADGSVRLTTRVRLTSERAPRDTVVTTVGELAYRRAGDRLVLGPRTPCPPNALCLGDYEARLVGTSGLVVEGTGGAPPGRWEYEAAR